MNCSTGAYLSPVGQPAHHTWYGKENREEVKRETFAVINAQHNLQS